jgi:Phosphotransferase enzyme family
MMGRTARVVLVTPDGALVGSLPPVEVSTPWWPDVEPVVRAVHDRYGLHIMVLRLLEAEANTPHGGGVTYLAEVPQPVPAEPWTGALEQHPLRHSFARPGGPAADLAWVDAVLAERGLRAVGRPVQVKTWNLSSLWRIPLEGQTAWLKVVPPFFAHEGPLLERLAGERVPTLIAQNNARMLLAEIPGSDLHHAELPVLLDMVTVLVELQRKWTNRVAELRALGLPDWRAGALSAAIADVIDRTSADLGTADRATLRDFVRSLPERYAEVAACGLDDSLIHGDFCGLNVRGDSHAFTLLDWGDSGVGHPLLDQSAFLDRSPSEAVDAVRQHWIQRWREAVPGADPARAFGLLSPVAAARQAVVYRHFLDCIEPAEQPYHRADPAERLRRVATLMRESRS